MNVTPVVSVQFSANVSDLTGSNDALIRLWLQMVTGTGANADECDQVYAAERSVVTATPDDLDLNAGGLVGLDHSVFSVLHVTTLLVVNMDTANQLIVGGTGNTFTSWLTGANAGVKIPPSSNATQKPSFLYLHGQASNAVGVFPVTAGTADLLRITTAKVTAHPYAIFLGGRST